MSAGACTTGDVVPPDHNEMMTIATNSGSTFGYGHRTLPRVRTGVAHRLATRVGRRLIDWGTRVRVEVDYAEHTRLYAEAQARAERERSVEVVARLM